MQGDAQISIPTPNWTPPTGTLGGLVRAAEIRASHVAGALPRLRDLTRDLAAPVSFAAVLRAQTVQIIAEVKRASPSKGAIAPGLDAVAQALAYVSGGAAAISVLTEPERFGGSLADLDAVSEAVPVPVLRKDFIVHPVQLWEARVNGASAALLIARALSPSQLVSLLETAAEAQLTALVEVRDEAELERAVMANAQVIGVNNRNLETLIIDTETAPRLIRLIPPDRIAIAESGLKDAADVGAAAATGADAVLVGSVFSAASNPAQAVRALTGMVRVGR